MIQENLVFSYGKLLHFVESDKSLIEDIMDIRRSFIHAVPVRAAVKYFGYQDLQDGRLKLRKNMLSICGMDIAGEIFEMFPERNLRSCILYLITAPGEYEERLNIEELSYHTVQNKCLDVVRNVIKHNFKVMTEKDYINIEGMGFTRFIGPGYFGMSLSEGKKIHMLLEGEKIGVTYIGDVMKPVKSTSGILLGMQGDEKMFPNPCSFCQTSGKNCLYCGGL